MDEELITNISDSIFNYIENSEDINLDDFIKNMSNNIIDKLDLRQYVGDIKILEVYDKNISSRGLLDNENNVCVFKQGIESDLNERLEQVPGLSEHEIKLYRCLLYTKTVLHELEHAKQKKLLAEDIENTMVETLITRLCDSKRRNDNVGYYCLYDAYPTERLAEVQALRTITKVTERLENKSDIELVAACIKKQAVFEEFYNYYNYGLSGPTEQYFSLLDSSSFSILKNEKEKREFSLEDRTLYGVEISRKEYEGMVMKYAAFDEKIKELSTVKKNK